MSVTKQLGQLSLTCLARLYVFQMSPEGCEAIRVLGLILRINSQLNNAVNNLNTLPGFELAGLCFANLPLLSLTRRLTQDLKTHRGLRVSSLKGPFNYLESTWAELALV